MLSMAAEMHKPVMMHARYSQRRCLEMLVAAGIERAVFHWYSGPPDILDEVLEAGYCISATPALALQPARTGKRWVTPPSTVSSWRQIHPLNMAACRPPQTTC